jgi:hypothetical protein
VTAQKIVLPADSTGKAIYTQERTVSGPGTVQVQYVISTSERVTSGVYSAQTGLHSVSVAATNGTTTGNWWLYNPSGSTVSVALRRIEFAAGVGAATVAILTAPRIMVSRFTFTGTPAGTAVTPAKVQSAYPTATATLRSTQVTSVVTLAGDLFALLPGIWNQSTSSGGPGVGMASDWTPDDDGQPVLAAGEGLACWQPDAGSTSDPRKFVTNIAWTEFTTP